MAEPTETETETPSAPRPTDPYRTRVKAAIVISILAAILLGWLAFSSPTQTVNGEDVSCTPLMGDVGQLSTFRTDLELDDVLISNDLEQDTYWYYQTRFDGQLTALCDALHQSRLTQITLVSVIGATIVLLLVLAPRRENRLSSENPV